MKGIPFVDVNYCQFSDWGYQKPTRIWGSPELRDLPCKLCDPRICPNVGPSQNGGWAHKRVLGATPEVGVGRVPKEEQYQVPPKLIEYIAGHILGCRRDVPIPIEQSEIPVVSEDPLESGDGECSRFGCDETLANPRLTHAVPGPDFGSHPTPIKLKVHARF